MRSSSGRQTLRVDTGCLVAMQPSVNYDIQFVGKVKTALFGGEGLFFATLTGPGKVWLQSLPLSRLADRIYKAIPGIGQGGRKEGSILGGLGKCSTVIERRRLRTNDQRPTTNDRRPKTEDPYVPHALNASPIHLRDERSGKVHPPDHVVLKDIWLSFLPAAKIGVLGLERRRARARCCASWPATTPSSSAKRSSRRERRLGFLPQEPMLESSRRPCASRSRKVWHAIRALLERFDAINARFGEELSPEEMDKVLEEQGKVQDRIDALNAWDLDSRLELAMDSLRCPPPETPVPTLSGGERRRVALCRLLLQQPDLLLLDEPTNHLDAESVAWLEHHLQAYPGTVVAVTHDRYFLDNVAGWILELDRWQRHSVGRQLLVVAGSEAAAARTRGEGGEPPPAHASARARLDSHVAPRPSGEGQGAPQRLRSSCCSRTPRRRSIRWRSTSRPVRGWATSSSKRPRPAQGLFGDNLLIDDLTFNLPRGGIVGVIGPNGAGKTTLFRMITGRSSRTAGSSSRRDGAGRLRGSEPRRTRRTEDSVGRDLGRARRDRSWDASSVASRAYVSWFNFKGRDQQKKVGTLSGGERNRVHLAKLLRGGSNLLLLDEPTNDLDVDTLRALEEALLNFAGCAVVISHDRWFLDRIATHILAFEGDSRVVWFEGNYQDYEADRRRRLGAEAERPHRIKYRKLTR